MTGHARIEEPSVSNDLTLLVNAARVSPILRDAAVRVEKRVYSLLSELQETTEEANKLRKLVLPAPAHAALREALERLVYTCEPLIEPKRKNLTGNAMDAEELAALDEARAALALVSAADLETM